MDGNTVKTRLEVTVFHHHSLKENGLRIDYDKVEKSTTIVVENDFSTAWEKALSWVAEEKDKKRCGEIFTLDHDQKVFGDYCSSEIREMNKKN